MSLTRDQFSNMIGQVRGNGSTPDEPLLSVFDAFTQRVGELTNLAANRADYHEVVADRDKWVALAAEAQQHCAWLDSTSTQHFNQAMENGGKAHEYRNKCEALQDQLTAVSQEREEAINEVTTLRACLEETQLNYIAAQHLADATSKEWQVNMARLREVESALAAVTREREFYIKQNLALLDRWNHGYTVMVEQARDALQAQLAAVTRERDAVREKSTEFWQRIVAAFAPAEVENIEVAVLLITTQKARLREVEGALRAYGRHSTTDRVCALSQHSDWACDCGLDAALRGPSEKEVGSE